MTLDFHEPQAIADGQGVWRGGRGWEWRGGVEERRKGEGLGSGIGMRGAG